MKVVLKSTLGAGLLAFGSWAVANAAFGPTTATGVLNAPLHILRAETSGRVALLAEIGNLVEAEQQVGAIAFAQAGHPSNLDALSAKRSAIPAIEYRMEIMEGIIEEIDHTAGLYKSSRIEYLESRVNEFEVQIDIALQEANIAANALERAEALFSAGHTTVLAVEDARSLLERKLSEQRLLESQKASRLAELEAARQGIFIGEGGNDLSTSVHRRSELALQLAALRAEHALLEQQVDPAYEQVAALEIAPTPILSPRGGVVWSMARQNGEQVAQGDELYRIADCSRLFVNTQLDASTFRSVRIGQSAQFVEIGTQTAWPGTIVRLNGTFGTDQMPMSIPEQNLPAQHAVVIALDGGLNGECNIGAIGTVVFDTETAPGIPPEIAVAWENFTRFTGSAALQWLLPASAEAADRLED